MVTYFLSYIVTFTKNADDLPIFSIAIFHGKHINMYIYIYLTDCRLYSICTFIFSDFTEHPQFNIHHNP